MHLYVPELFLLHVAEEVCEYTEDESAGNGSDGDFAECNDESADAGDEDDGSGEEVSVVAEVNGLKHLETGYRDEAVKGYAYAAHYAGRNGCEEGGERSHESGEDGEDGGSEYGNDGSVAGNSYAAYGFTVSGVGAAAEESACDGADAVAEKSSVKTGIFKKVLTDDGGKILVVCDMFRKYDECNGNVGNGDGADIGSVDIGKSFESGDESEVGKPLHIFEEVKIDNAESVAFSGDADDGEDSGNDIAAEDTEHERYHFCHFLSVNGEEHNGEESNETADKCNVNGSGGNIVNGVAAFLEIADGVAGKRKSDDGNGRSDNYCGHEFCDPLDAAEFNYDGNDNVNETCEESAEKKSGIACCRGNRAGKSGAHGAEESKGASEEDGAVEFGEAKVNECADACSEEGCGLGHSVADDGGNGNGGCEDGEELLECKDEYLPELGLVFYAVNEVHGDFPFDFCLFCVFAYNDSMTASFTPSYSGTLTLIISRLDVGTFLPT